MTAVLHTDRTHTGKDRFVDMKKSIAIVLCLLLFVCLVPAGILAEPPADPSDESSAESSSPSPSNPFDGLEITAVYTKVTGTLTLYWDLSKTEGYGATEVQIGADSYPVEAADEGAVSASVPGLDEGTYTALLVFAGEGDGASQTVNFGFKIKYNTEDIMGFTFKENVNARSFDAATGVLTISWNQEDAPAGTKLTGIKLDGKVYSSKDGDSGVTTISGLAKVKVGRTPFSYEFQLADGSAYSLAAGEPLFKAGNLKTAMTVAVENGYITAVLLDEYNRPVVGAGIYVKINDNTFSKAVKTNAQGKVVFTQVALPSNLDSILCIFDEATIDGIVYTKCVKGIRELPVPPTSEPTTPPSTSTTTEPSTSTTESTTGTTESTTTSGTDPLETTTGNMILGPGTTGVEGNLIALNASFNEGILSTFGLTKEDFDSRARLLVTSTIYQTFIGAGPNMLMLSLSNSSVRVDSTQLANAIKDEKKYKDYDASRAGILSLDLSLLFIDTTTQTQAELPGLAVGEEKYIVQLPVPNAMRNVPLFTVVKVGPSGLGELLDVTVQDGYMRFTVDTLGTYAVVGFVEDEPQAQSSSILLIVLIVVGVLMLIGAGLLIYFFVIRRPQYDDDDELTDDELTMLVGEPTAQIPADQAVPLVPGMQSGNPDNAAKEDEYSQAGSVWSSPAMQDVPKTSGQDAPAGLDDRDIYSSDTKRPPYRSRPSDGREEKTQDISLGSFQKPENNPANKPHKKNPNDYDIDL